MPKRKTIARTGPSWDSEISLLAWLATCISVFSFLFYYQRGEVLLYGDAVAHINIARRVFDSRTPGLLQLGTVWLPLPHLLMIPFLISDKLWRTGAGGSIPSMIAYVFSVVGMFRLVRGALSGNREAETGARFAAWASALLLGANPNLIYMQSTAMGEAVYLAFFIWTVVFFSDFVRGNRRALTKCGWCVFAACLTRYDGWFLAVVMVLVVLILILKQGNRSASDVNDMRQTRTLAAKFVLLSALAPTLWLAYNGIVYRNPLEFENGPYSAKAIEHRTQSAGTPGHPGSGNLLLAARYFLKSAEINLAENSWQQRAWILLCAGGLFLACLSFSASGALPGASSGWVLLLLFVPLPFYALSIAFGGVPIFIPPWWPFTHYNVRYGLQLLPAFAAALGILLFGVMRFRHFTPRIRLAAVLCLAAFSIASYALVWRSGPVCLQEAQVNMRTRHQLEKQLADWLMRLPPDSTILMYLGDHVGALQQAGIPLRRTINEGNHRVWRQPSDAEGLWERALAHPAAYADYVIAFEGDPVWQAVQSEHLNELVEIHVTGQARAILYRAR